MKQSVNAQRKYLFAKSFISGGIAGIVSKTLIAPIERTSQRVFTYSSYLNDVGYIVKTHGILNLWRGNFLNIARIFPYSAIVNLRDIQDFSVFDYLRRRYYNERQDTVRQKMILFLCGASAGICAMTITIPFEFIRLAMEKDNFTYRNNYQAFKKVIQEEGVFSFYQGYGASLLGVAIYHGFSFFIFSTVKKQIKKKNSQNYKKWYYDFFTGGISAAGQLLCYPLDIIRKRKQAQKLLFQKQQIGKILNYSELIRSIWKNQGIIKGFYKGMSLNLIKAPIANATSWTVKNHINRLLDESYDL